MKFAHTLGGIGLLGAMVCLLILIATMPEVAAAPDRYLQQREGMNAIAQWLLLPSLGLTLVSGLLSMAAVPGFHSAGWAWLKLATGVLMFEGTLLAVQGPIEAETRLARETLAAGGDIVALGQTLSAEGNSLWVLAAVAVLNVLLGVWRPVFSRWKWLRFGAD